MRRLGFHWTGLVALLLAFGCSGEKPQAEQAVVVPPSKNTASNPTEEPPKTAARVSDRPGNTAGKVFIVEYHHVLEKEDRWNRSIDRFKSDLQRFYDMGFRPVTVGEYLSGKMNLPPGASPMVFTFDDAGPSQFRMLDDGTVDPKCAVGLWLEFAKKHPDFPVKATWYVLPGMWGQPKWIEKKVQLIKEWGSELGSHTITHANLKNSSEEQVKKELGDAIDMLNGYGFDKISIALPFGISPKNAELLKRFTYKGKEYSMTGAMLVGAHPAPSPTDPKLDKFRVPRIQAIEGSHGITYWLDKVKSGEVEVYVEP